MGNALALLLLAVNLLTQVANSPNLPQSFKDNAVSIANVAISEANKELAATSTAIISPISVAAIQPIVNPQIQNQQPIFGSTMQTSMSETPTDKSAITLLSQDIDYRGLYAFVVQVLDTNGKPIHKAPIHISTSVTLPEWYTIDRYTDSEGPTSKSENWRTTFGEIALIKGSNTIIFTSGNLTKEITITVE